jgi:heme/copper-type cytochrome/quinol oxidase subunit 4
MKYRLLREYVPNYLSKIVPLTCIYSDFNILIKSIRIIIIIIIIIIMFMKDQACFLFLDPQNEIGPSISFSVFVCSFVLLIYIGTLVLIFYAYLCPSSVCVVATFPGTVLFLKIKLKKRFFGL